MSAERHPQYMEAVRVRARLGVERAFYHAQGKTLPVTLADVKLLAIYYRDEEERDGSRTPLMQALEELNKLAEITLDGEEVTA